MIRKITHSRLCELLRYEPDTGNLIWLVSPKHDVKAGDIAGGMNDDGYIIVKVDGRSYRAHVLAYFYMRKSWPKYQVDHIDTNRANNRWANLRSATNGQNGANKGLTRANKSGFKGVSFDCIREKHRATIQVDHKKIHLGYFDCPYQASAAFETAAQIHHGAFARITSSPKVDELMLPHQN